MQWKSSANSPPGWKEKLLSAKGAKEQLSFVTYLIKVCLASLLASCFYGETHKIYLCWRGEEWQKAKNNMPQLN